MGVSHPDAHWCVVCNFYVCGWKCFKELIRDVKLQQQLQELETLREQVKDIEQLHKEREASQEELRKLRQTLREQVTDIERLRNEHEASQEELQRLKQRFAELQAKKEAVKEGEAFSKEVETLTESTVRYYLALYASITQPATPEDLWLGLQAFARAYSRSSPTWDFMDLSAFFKKLYNAAKTRCDELEATSSSLIQPLAGDSTQQRQVQLMCAHMWKSQELLHGREFCFIFNDAFRSPCNIAMVDGQAINFVRGLTRFSPGRTIDQVGPYFGTDPHVSYRGTKIPEAVITSFWTPGRRYRCGTPLSTTKDRRVINMFMQRDFDFSVHRAVRFEFKFLYGCKHAHPIEEVNGMGESELLLAPLSILTVLSNSLLNEDRNCTGFPNKPYVIELEVAHDNKVVDRTQDVFSRSTWH